MVSICLGIDVLKRHRWAMQYCDARAVFSSVLLDESEAMFAKMAKESL
jgi:hypothetical protein